MNVSEPIATSAPIGVSLVDGDATIRHARQIMLRSENYEVRSYATCAAILADPLSRNFPCIVLDIDLSDDEGAALLHDMRASGWRGHAILLNGQEANSDYVRNAERNGDQVMERAIGDNSLIAAISASVERGLSAAA